jgi:aminoglycoside N3'-acetyltransferase
VEWSPVHQPVAGLSYSGVNVMSVAHDARSVAIMRQIHDRVVKVLGHDLKIVVPEFDLIDSKITVYDDTARQKMTIRVDFILEPNGLK